ncbi:MAG: chromosome segregation protein SMC, partial [Chloroflexota bacterium]
MHLKRVELFGFKSFADRTEVDFDSGVTAVVGPNGSGKSNVCDAIRWVLGEQSARQLRGSRMEDVIFDGSESRRGLGIAEVTLTLDNSDGGLPVDYSEVMITRRTFRSGESEYYINKVPCRLRDITDLLADTGMGKENYSVISQGRIDEILSNRPEDRRGLFEEAAGITKFKTRKAEAQRRLTETGADLARVADIISELESQLGPLADQAAVTRQYNDWRGELTRLEVSVLAQRSKALRAEYDGVDERLKGLLAQLAAVDSRMAEIEQESDAGNAELSAAAQRRESIQEVATGAAATHERLAAQVDAIDARLQELASAGADLLARAADVDARIAALATERDETERRRAAAEELVRERRLTVDRHQRRVDEARGAAAAQAAQIQQLKSDVFTLLSAAAEERNKAMAAKVEGAALRKRLERVDGDLARATAEGEAAEQVRAAAAAAVRAASESQAAADERLEAAAESRRQAELQADRQAQEARVLTNKATLLASRLRVLEENERRYDGYARGVRAVLQARRKGEQACAGVIGSVVELISAPSQYGKAIEMAIGAAAQNVVVRTDDDARMAIEYLRRSDGGRATFLPLSVIAAAPLRPDEAKASEMPGAVGFADTLVSFAPEYRDIVAWLLGRVLVVSDLDAGVRIARATGHRLKIVTLDGDVLHRGGSMTGGSYSQETAGLFVRRQEVETLRSDLAAAEAEAAQARERETALRQRIEAAIKAADEARELRYQAESAALAAGRDLAAAESDLAKAATLAAAAAGEREEVIREIAANDGRAAAAASGIERLEKELEQAQQRLAEAEGAGQRGGAEADELSEVVTRLRVELAEAEGELARAGDACAAIEARLAELTAERDRIAAERAEGERRREALAAERAECQQQLAQAREAREAAEAGLAAARAEEEQQRLKAAARERESRSLRRQGDSLQTKIREDEVERARLEMELGQTSGRLLEEYQLTPEAAERQADPAVDGRTAVGRIEELKAAIRDLGPVNAQAIEEFDRVRDRCEFLRRQQLDLELAKANLLQVISEMDELMERRFAEQFELIRLNFTQVFRELFGGGHAELHLSDAGNLLETGVEIRAQPPGKKLQSLSLMSGGERALTAI